jgi:hypothetical protein
MSHCTIQIQVASGPRIAIANGRLLDSQAKRLMHDEKAGFPADFGVTGQ